MSHEVFIRGFFEIMNWVKTHPIVKSLFPKYIWTVPDSPKKVYLTFDDGPIPDITEWVLDLLEKENIKATFFCIGTISENTQKFFKK
nr:polysaccharide deacetylase family protein [Flavobacterium sediminis]